MKKPVLFYTAVFKILIFARRLNIIERIQKIGKRLYQIYFGIGVAAMGLLALNVIFSVTARYCFSLGWKQLAEFNVTVFAFTTFWAMGICMLQGEHVMIDIFYDGIKPAIKRWLTVANYIIVLGVDLVFSFFAYKYTLMAGVQISQGMEVPMYFMYGIMPLSGLLCAVCIILKIVECITADISAFAPKNKVLTQDNSSPKEKEA